MKQTILTLLIALMSVTALSAQEVKNPVYIIDGETVENFDGSQLNGKVIVKYTVEDGVHAIFTADYAKQIGDVKVLSANGKNVVKSVKRSDIPGTMRLSPGETVFVVDGKITSAADVVNMSSSKIAAMDVIKDQQNANFIKYSQEAKKSGNSTPKCIIMITTK